MKNPSRSTVLPALVIVAGLGLFTSCSTSKNRDAAPSVAARAGDFRVDPLVHTAPQLAPVAAVPVTLTPEVSEVVRLTQSGMSEEVLLAYVEKSEGPFLANAEQVIEIRDSGVPQRVIQAMLQHPANRPVLIRQVEPSTVVQPIQTNMLVEAAQTNAVVVAQPAPIVVQQPVTTVVAAPAPVTVVTPPVAVEYRELLDPYGSWVEVPSYGWCWQPTIAIRDRLWRPYHSGGRWIYTSNHGWYWLSDYNWGHLPFHYGRWTRNSRFGWVWVPGNTWGPAWVSWRYGRSHVGWAPLPPHARFLPRSGFRFRGSRVSVGFEFGLGFNDYTFCPIGSFYSPSPYRHYINRSRNTVIYNQTTVVNNYNTATTSAPANQGVPVQAVQTASRTVVSKVKVLDRRSVSGRALVQPGRVVRSNGDLAVFREPLRTPATTKTVTATTARTANPVTPVRTPVSKTTTASPRLPTRSGASSSRVVISKPVNRSSSVGSRTQIRPKEPVKSRTIFVEQVPVVRRPSSRPAAVSSGSRFTSTPSRSSNASSRSSSSRSPVVAKPVPVRVSQPEPAPEPVRTTTPKSTTVRSRTTSTPAPTVVRQPVSKPVVVTAPRTTLPARTVVRPTPTPSRTTATIRPVARPAAPTVRPRVVASPPPAPAPARSVAAPARTPVSRSSSSSGSSTATRQSDDSSSTPSARPSRRPARKP